MKLQATDGEKVEGIFAGCSQVWRDAAASADVMVGVEADGVAAGVAAGAVRVEAAVGCGGVEGELVRLEGDPALTRTHALGECELHEAEEATATGVGLLWTCAAGVWRQACTLLHSLGEVMQEVEDTGKIGQHDSQKDNSVHFVYATEGDTERASVAVHRTNPEWVLDSGASKHVTGNSKEFELYTQYPHTHQGTIQTADGTAQPITGIGLVHCTPKIKLSSVLHVPAFPVNLVSLSALIDQLDCRIILDKHTCVIHDRQTGQKIGTGTRHS